MTAAIWERALYRITYAFATAWFDAMRDNRKVDLEEPDEASLARANRFRTAVQRVQSGSGGTPPVNSPSTLQAGDGLHRSEGPERPG